jgi:hypothetical protein
MLIFKKLKQVYDMLKKRQESFLGIKYATSINKKALTFESEW